MNNISEEALSKQQQKFFALVHSLQKGNIKPSEVSAKARKAAKEMDPEEVTKYASTKHKGLPKKVKKEGAEDGSIAELYVVTMPQPGCTPDSLVKTIDPLSGISGTEISPDQVQGVYPSADVARMMAEKMCEEYEERQRVLEEKKTTTTDKLKKVIDKLEKKRKEHMDAAKEDPKNASEHRTAIADLATKIDDYITKLEKIEKSKKTEEKKEKEDKKDKKSIKEGEKGDYKVKNYLVKGDNQILVRIEDSIQMIEDALNQIIKDPKKNTRGLAKYAMDSLEDIKELIIK